VCVCVCVCVCVVNAAVPKRVTARELIMRAQQQYIDDIKNRLRYSLECPVLCVLCRGFVS
jgi:hypothetical protein